MKRILLSLFIFVLYCSGVYSKTFDFTKHGDDSSNEILKEFINDNIANFEGDVVSYFYDINDDNIQEIIGIAKTTPFYNSGGYKLIVIKKQFDDWSLVKNNIYFDIKKNLKIEKDKATYYRTSFNVSRKYKTKIMGEVSDNVAAAAKIEKVKNTNKVKNKNGVLPVTEGTTGVEIDISEIIRDVQKPIIIRYKD